MTIATSSLSWSTGNARAEEEAEQGHRDDPERRPDRPTEKEEAGAGPSGRSTPPL